MGANAFHRGFTAFRKGYIGNPFGVNTKDHRDYEFGFNKAYFENLERQKEYERKANKKKILQNQS